MTEQEKRARFFAKTNRIATIAQLEYQAFCWGIEFGAEKEREACAKLCEERPDLKIATTYDWTRQVGQDLAQAIRERSNAEVSGAGTASAGLPG